MKRTKRKIINHFKYLDHLINEDYIKLSDKYKKLKLSHKKLEQLLMNYRTILISIQNDINLSICNKCVEQELRNTNLALGFNQWASVKFQIQKCEDETAICYVKSDAISCIRKEPI